MKILIMTSSTARPLVATEAQIQHSILQYLGTVRGGYFWRNNSGAVKTQYKGRSGFLRFGKVGSADIIGVLRGRFVAIEVKGRKGKVSDEQRDFITNIDRCGGYAIIARSLDDVIALVDRIKALPALT